MSGDPQAMLAKSPVLSELEMLDLRRKGVGGSDVSAIVGMNPWKTGHDVWLQKMDLYKPEVGEAAMWGRLLEPIIGQEYARREGVQIYQPEPRFVRDKDYDWILGNLDFLVRGRPIGVDPKTAGLRQAPRWGETETDEIPEEYLLQMQWYLYITRATIERWDVPVLLGQNLRIYRVFPNADLQRRLVDICGEWWERYVLTKTPPPPDHSKSARRLIETLFPQEQGAIRAALPDEETLVWQYRDLDRRIDAVMADRDRITNLIRAAIGQDAGLSGPGFKVTWKRIKDSVTPDWEAVAKALAARLATSTGQDGAAVLDYEKRLRVKTKEGYRRFLPTFEKEEEEDAAKAVATTSPGGET